MRSAFDFCPGDFFTELEKLQLYDTIYICFIPLAWYNMFVTLPEIIVINIRSSHNPK